MTQCNTLNVKLSDSRLHKSKSEIKNWTEVILKISSNVIGNSNDESNFRHKLLWTDTQVSQKTRKAIANGLSANIKFSKTQLSEMIQSGGFNILDLMKKDLSNKVPLDDKMKTGDISRKFLPDPPTIFGTGITQKTMK